MTSYPELHRGLMDAFQDHVEPMLRRAAEGGSMTAPGPLWTARLNIAGFVVQIDDWLAEHGNDLFHIQQAKELRAFFVTHREGGYSVEECIAALKEETRKWTNGKGYVEDPLKRKDW
jgi:hypothetical protein